MNRLIKAWQKIRGKGAAVRARGRSFNVYEPNAPKRARQKSIRVLRDLIFVFIVFAIAFVLSFVLDLHGSFEAASLELKDSPFQYDELIVALAILAAALCVFAMRRWRELETEIVERVQVEQALVDSEERYRTLAEAAQDFIFIANRQGLIQYLNSYAAGKLGNRPDAFVGKSLQAVFPPEMAEGQNQELKKVFANGEPLNVEHKATLGGEESWLSTSLVPIRDDAGAFDSVLGIARDITIRKLAEDALLGSKGDLEKKVSERTLELSNLNQRLKLELGEKKLAEERLQAVNRALRTTMAAHQALTGAEGEPELLYQICKALVEVGGYRFAWVGFAEQGEKQLVRPVASAGYEEGYLEAEKVSWDESSEFGAGPVGNAIRSGGPSVVRDVLVDETYAPWRSEATRRGFASTVSLPLSSNGDTFGALNIYAAEPDAFDGEEVELLSELAGDLSYGISALRTRGERDQQALTLRRTGEQFSLLVESLPIIFYTSQATDEFGITYVSKNMEAFTGYTPEEVTADTSFWADHIHPEDAPRAFEEMSKVFSRGFHEYEYRWLSADGSYKWFLDILRLVKTPEGEEDYIVGMWLDITARKQGEERLLQVKDQLEDDAQSKSVELQVTLEQLERATRRLERQQHEITMLNQMDELLQGCLTIKEAYAAFASFAGRMAEGGSGALYILDENAGRYEEVASWGASPPLEKGFEPDDCWSLRLGQIHVYSGVETGMKCQHASAEDPHICIPVRAAGNTFGVLVMLFPPGEEFDDSQIKEEQELAAGLAARVGMAVYSLNLRRAVQGAAGDDFEKQG